MLNKLKGLISVFCLVSQFLMDAQCVDKITDEKISTDDHITKCPLLVKVHIFEMAAYEVGASKHNLSHLALVCKDWNEIVKHKAKNRIKLSWLKGLYDIKDPKEIEILERVCKGVLCYKGGNELIEMPLWELINPVEGTFALTCPEKINVSISIGCPEGKKEENNNKLEIIFVLRFLVKRKVNTTAGHFKEIFDEWSEDAPVAIILRWGGWNITWYNYTIPENLEALSNNNLLEKWRVSHPSPIPRSEQMLSERQYLRVLFSHYAPRVNLDRFYVRF